MNKKLYIVLILILTIAFSTKAIANLTLGTTSVTSNGPLTLSTSSSTLILPSTNGTNGQVLTTNGAGTTSWSTVSGGGITNGAGNNVIPKSDGTNLVGSRISDDGTNIYGNTDGSTLTYSVIFGAGDHSEMSIYNNDNDPTTNFAHFFAPGGTTIIGDGNTYNYTHLSIVDNLKSITATAGTESIAIDGVAHTITLKSVGDDSSLLLDSDGAALGDNNNLFTRIRTSTGTGTIINTAATSISNVTPLWEAGGAGTEFQINSGGSISNYGGVAPTNGQLMIGHEAHGTFESGNLTAGTGISITNGSGSITISSNILSGTTGNIGGGALVAGTCTNGDATITGATIGMVAIAQPSDGGDPGAFVYWRARVRSADTVRVDVCVSIAGTPAAKTYNVRVIQ